MDATEIDINDYCARACKHANSYFRRRTSLTSRITTFFKSWSYSNQSVIPEQILEAIAGLANLYLARLMAIKEPEITVKTYEGFAFYAFDNYL